jgi:hypothetical protein
MEEHNHHPHQPPLAFQKAINGSPHKRMMQFFALSKTRKDKSLSFPLKVSTIDP